MVIPYVFFKSDPSDMVTIISILKLASYIVAGLVVKWCKIK